VRKKGYRGKYLDLEEKELQEAAEYSILRILMIFYSSLDAHFSVVKLRIGCMRVQT